ncbi:MAG: response regulator transcription factor [Oleiphilaceae bacterium]|nr:response regulator transcription factor [Oleiphilaceae bacterium]
MNDTIRKQSLLIADDEPLARERLRRLVDELPDYRICGEAGDGDAALRLVAEQHPDIVLLDIRMPGRDGLAVAEKLNDMTHPPAIIFCTAFDHYAINAFDVQAVAYLLKPVRREALAEALANAGRVNRVQLQAVQTGASGTQNRLVARTHRGTEMIDLHAILYCAADHKCVTIHHDRGETVTDFTLKELEQNYPELLLRIHRQTLVGAHHITALYRGKDGHYRIQLGNQDTELAVSRRHATDVRNRLSQA